MCIRDRWYGIPCINVVAGLGYVFMHDTVRTRMGRLIWRIAFGLATRIVTLNPDDARLLVGQGFVAGHRIDLVNGDSFSGVSSSQPPAVAGYPAITVPAGFVSGLPVGMTLMGPAWSEGALIKYAYAFEQATKHRVAPTLARTVPLADASE